MGCGRQPVIGINKYRVDADEAIEVLRVDNADVLAQQKAKLAELRGSRADPALQEALRRRRAAAPAGVRGPRAAAGGRGALRRPPAAAGAAAEGRRGRELDSNLLKLAVDAA